jgi:hypothetical protein
VEYEIALFVFEARTDRGFDFDRETMDTYPNNGFYCFDCDSDKPNFQQDSYPEYVNAKALNQKPSNQRTGKVLAVNTLSI